MTTIELDTMLSFTRREHKVSQQFLYYYTDFERAKETLAPEFNSCQITYHNRVVTFQYEQIFMIIVKTILLNKSNYIITL